MSETGKEIATREGVTTVRTAFKRHERLITELLPKHINQSTFVNVATNTIVSTPKLLDADFKTLFRQVLQCGVLGLMPDSIMGLAYLVPFYNTKKTKYDVQLIIGYKGLIELAMRSNRITSINAEIVYSKEIFNISLGTDRRIDHIPLPPSERGDMKGVYSVVKFKDGTSDFQFLFKEDVEKFRSRSSSAWTGHGDNRQLNPQSVWVQFEEAMWKKTAIRQLCKYLPMSQELTRAVAYDEATEAGVEVPVDFQIDDEPTYDIEPKMLEELTGLFDQLGINKADRGIELARCKGDDKKALELRKRLKKQVADANAKQEGGPHADDIFGKPPQENQ